jgi:hypothetical protein
MGAPPRSARRRPAHLAPGMRRTAQPPLSAVGRARLRQLAPPHLPRRRQGRRAAHRPTRRGAARPVRRPRRQPHSAQPPPPRSARPLHGTSLATGHYDGTILLWSTQSWKPVGRVLEGHEGRVESLLFAPDGRTLASAGADGAVLLRDVASQKTVGSAQAGEPNAYLSADFTPDGARLVAVPEQTSRDPLGGLLPGLGATRLPRRRARADPQRVAGRTARAAVPLDLPRRLTRPDARRRPALTVTAARALICPRSPRCETIRLTTRPPSYSAGRSGRSAAANRHHAQSILAGGFLL